ncbi:MAG: DegT/DnrJ/EryC1/StrS family aminotransferase [Balneolales bacterium]
MIPPLDLTPEIKEIRREIDATIKRVIDSTAFILGPDVKAFEEEAAAYLGVKHAIGVNSGTDALVIAMKSLGIGSGDEVITTPFSFFATAESISILGAKPVFVDVEADTFNIDPEKIEAAITPATKALLPVHLFGRPANMGRIMEIAGKHGLYVIEDAAQSFGARYLTDPAKSGNNGGRTTGNAAQTENLQGKQTGSMGNAGAISFFPTKNLGGFGDGGLIVTNDDQLAETARMLRSHGSRKKYHNELLGYNSRLDTIQAAVLRVKLPYIDRWNKGRREAAQRYNKLFEGHDNIVTPEIIDGHVFHQYTLRLLETDRNEVQAALKEAGVGSMVYYPVPQDRLPIYRDEYPRNPVSDELAEQVISLPIWPTIDEATQEKVATALLMNV